MKFIKSEEDFFAGVLFAAVGLAFAIGATNYNIGTGARMGPGYFPLGLGVILTILGGIIMLKGMAGKEGARMGKVALRPLACIIGANVLFGILLGGLPKLGIPAMGLVVGIYGLTIVASLADKQFRLKSVLILATILAIISYGAFVKLLNLQFQIWPAFITG
ncbi:tripartite tricarboxylate transporter TctB family protein [Rhodoferax sp. BAB1]|uniref:tripartite tricarboxylate transporter TctB family protein n=1 Tax=Rhodoferax sp. BAB1 TaxID=2741720 RepID=UPI0015775AB7|nr:tripartite tricarboxylate transporter TctB family protein [Rhodoferax sp. BAB1]QKO22592.1 tripartite tricarboxylate transporter TctB family protein [Rhodoferax sp. BAB1]